MAVSVVINEIPGSISSDAFSLNVTVKGAKNGNNYLRVEIYKDGSTNYFGETFNGKDWYHGSDGINYFPLSINSASTSATIQARVGNSKEYQGVGAYKLKIKRYTSSGNAANDVENPVDININFNLQTPMSTPIPVTSTPFAATTAVSPAEIILPTVLPTKTPLKEAIVLADETQPTPLATAGRLILSKSQTFPVLPAIIFGIGVFLVGIVIYKVYTKSSVLKRKKNS